MMFSQASYWTCLLLAYSLVAYTTAETSINIHSSPSVVEPSSKFQLNCNVMQDYYDREFNITSILLFKETQAMEMYWRLIAQVNDLAPDEVSFEEDSVDSSSGTITTQRATSPYNKHELGQLSLVWNKVTTDSFGKYKCQVTWFDLDQNLVTKSEDISIGSDLKPTAILGLMQTDRKEIMEKISRVANSMSEVEKDITTMIKEDAAAFKIELDKLEKELNSSIAIQNEAIEELSRRLEGMLTQTQQQQTEKLSEVSSHLNVALKRGFVMFWPSGSFALPQPNSGCPMSGGKVWPHGARKIHTESTDRNDDWVSEDNHLKKPVVYRKNRQNFIYQRFCVKADADLPGLVWPSGSYCFNRVKECPNGFTDGSVTWDEENDSSLSENESILPDITITQTATTFKYCCRNDSAPDHPVHLPRSKPFYLYRYGGRCQQVVGMKATEEIIYFDTENTRNLSVFDLSRNGNGDVKTGMAPDAELDNIQLHLCHYDLQ